MSEEVIRLAQEVADLRRRVRGMCRYGTVEEVDPAAGTVRLRLGADYLSAPIPYAQTAGAMKVHNPPSVGQQMMALSPNGDLRQAFAQPFAFSNANASPSGAGDEHVIVFGAITITVRSDRLVIRVGSSTFVISTSEITQSSGEIHLN